MGVERRQTCRRLGEAQLGADLEHLLIVEGGVSVLGADVVEEEAWYQRSFFLWHCGSRANRQCGGRRLQAARCQQAALTSGREAQCLGDCTSSTSAKAVSVGL